MRGLIQVGHADGSGQVLHGNKGRAANEVGGWCMGPVDARGWVGQLLRGVGDDLVDVGIQGMLVLHQGRIGTACVHKHVPELSSVAHEHAKCVASCAREGSYQGLIACAFRQKWCIHTFKVPAQPWIGIRASWTLSVVVSLYLEGGSLMQGVTGRFLNERNHGNACVP